MVAIANFYWLQKLFWGEREGEALITKIKERKGFLFKQYFHICVGISLSKKDRKRK